MMSDKTNQKEDIDKIMELLPDAYIEAGGRLDVLIDIFDEQLSDLRKAKNQFIEAGIEDSFPDENITESENIIKHMRISERHGHIKATAEFNKKKETDKKKTKAGTEGGTEKKLKRRAAILKIMSKYYEWHTGDPYIPRPKCNEIKKDLRKEIFTNDSDRTLTLDFVKLGIQKKKN